jgi:putative nucleotidyltransferase with HDIG domain
MESVSETPTGAAVPNRRVYLAKGNPTFVRLLTKVFRDAGGNSLELFGRDELIEAIGRRPPDVVVLVDDPALYERLRRAHQAAGIPVLYVLVAEADQDKVPRLAPSDRTWVLRNQPAELSGVLKEVRRVPRAKRVLCVDDSPTLLAQLRKAFIGTPYQVFTAENGEKALQILDEVAPDVVLTDVEMPVMNGLAFCQAVRSRPVNAGLPLIILSSRVDHETIAAGFEAGADEYMAKPFFPDELLNKVESYLIPPPARRQEQVLVVAGEPNVVHHLRQALGQQGFEVRIQPLADEAPRTIREAKPDLIIADTLGDPAAGYQLCEQIRRMPGAERIPFVLMTEKTSAGARKMGKLVGISSYLTKPFTREGLILLVERLLAERRSQKAIEWDVVLASITSLARALDERDPYTRFHSENVARYSVAIGRKAGLNSDQIETLKQAGLLHDIGKIGIPDRVLHKPGRLTEEEFEIIKEHSRRGADILKPIPLLEQVVPAILHHHERIDGRGYPKGLAGDQIPVLARMLAVADTYDALVTDRPYRQGMPVDKAREIMAEVAGAQLDAGFVRLFLEWLDESA